MKACKIWWQALVSFLKKIYIIRIVGCTNITCRRAEKIKAGVTREYWPCKSYDEVHQNDQLSIWYWFIIEDYSKWYNTSWTNWTWIIVYKYKMDIYPRLIKLFSFVIGYGLAETLLKVELNW